MSAVFLILLCLRPASAFAGEFPEKYDLRTQGRAPAPGDQGSGAACWAYAALYALSTGIGGTPDFSEGHLLSDPAFPLASENGGDYIMSMAYLAAWRGPVLEEDFSDGGMPRAALPAGGGAALLPEEPVEEAPLPARQVLEMQLLSGQDTGAIKEAVMTVGGVQTCLYVPLAGGLPSADYYNAEASAFYYPEATEENHAVVIVGWDDTYPGENFPVRPPSDGAFLCAGSWGTDFGLDGFFYVSYCDANLGRTSLVYTRVEDVGFYRAIYQSDACGWTGQLGCGADSAWAVNVFTAADAETLCAVGFYAVGPDTSCEVYVLPGLSETPGGAELSSLIEAGGSLASAVFPRAGYYTVQLQEEIALKAGERFGVAVKVTTPGEERPLAVEYDAKNEKYRVDLSDGEGYSSRDGISWERTETAYASNLCLKAYTR